MKFNVLKHIEKVFALALTLIWISMAVSLVLKPPPSFSDDLRVRPFGLSLKEKDELIAREVFMEKMKAGEDKFKYELLLSREMFGEIKQPKGKGRVVVAALLEVVAISHVPLPLKYMGFIELELPGGALALRGQVHWGEQTLFISPGDKIRGFKIVSITKEQILAQRGRGEEKLVLPIRERILGKELVATVYDRIQKRKFSGLKVGDVFGGGVKTPDIDASSVLILMLDGKEEKLFLKK